MSTRGICLFTTLAYPSLRGSLAIGLATFFVYFGFSSAAFAQNLRWTHEITNGTLWIRMDQDRGGIITDIEILSSSGSIRRRNIVNNTDWTGRAIQGSLYEAGSDPSCWPCNSSCTWKWNPVQGGNACQAWSGGSVLEHTTNRIRSATTPLNWNNLLGRSNVYMEQTLELVGPNTLYVQYFFRNNEPFTIGINGERHELPVVYLEPSFSTQLSYEGPAPFTYDSLTVQGPTTRQVVTTEPWVALQDSYGWTIALVVPGFYNHYDFHYITDGGAIQTQLMQAWQHLQLSPGQEARFGYYLVMADNLSTVRSTIYELIQRKYTISLLADAGTYVVAEDGGGSVVNANRPAVGPWEIFTLTDMNGGDLLDGDPVYIQSDNGSFLHAENGGGARLLATGTDPWTSANRFVIRRWGGGRVENGDYIGFQGANSQYWCAEGGGNEVNVNRDNFGTWETFWISWW